MEQNKLINGQEISAALRAELKAETDALIEKTGLAE